MKSMLVCVCVLLASSASFAFSPIGTSFENEAVPGGQYTDTGDASVDHALLSNVGEPVINRATVGSDLGYQAFYRNTRNDVGLTDGDFVGVTDFTGQVGAYTDGFQGYELSDADGTMDLVFDLVDTSDISLVTVSLDAFINPTGYESDDLIQIFVETDLGITSLLDTTGSDINDLGIEGVWNSLSVTVPGDWAVLTVSLESNSSSENLYIDNVSIIPEPTTMVMLELGGLTLLRRRKASA